MNDQPSLFDYPPRLYAGAPPSEVTSETSVAAASSMKQASNTIREQVFDVIRLRGGATDDELEVALQMRHQTVSARRRELVLLGRVKPSGQRRITRSGRAAEVWTVEP